MRLYRTQVPAITASIAFALGLCGCKDGSSQQYLDLARQSVTTALDAWKRGEKPESLKTGPSGIDCFDDDWQRSARLVNYEITNVYMETDGTARCVVTLTVEPKGKPPQEIQVTYQVVDKDNGVAIARNPF